MIVLGFASIGGLVGIIAAIYVGVTALAMEPPDDAEYLPFVMMVGAGAGWLIGTGLGSIAGSRARPPGATGRRLVLLGAVAVVIGAATIAIWPNTSGWPDGEVTFFSTWRVVGGTELEIATMVDAAIAAFTFLAVRRHHDGEGSAHPRRVAGAIGTAGLLLGGLAFAYGVAIVPMTWSGNVRHLATRAVYRTTTSLVEAAGEHQGLTGSFPTNLAEVLAAGAKVRPGTQVEFAGVVNGSFCVRVGVDVGEQHADDPHYSALVHTRPPGSKSWTSAETWTGNSCTNPE